MHLSSYLSYAYILLFTFFQEKSTLFLTFFQGKIKHFLTLFQDKNVFFLHFSKIRHLSKGWIPNQESSPLPYYNLLLSVSIAADGVSHCPICRC